MSRDLFYFIQKIFFRDIRNKYSDEEIVEIVNNLSKDFGDYVDKDPEYHDKVIKEMYTDTRFSNESPDELRKILREQFSNKPPRKKVS